MATTAARIGMIQTTEILVPFFGTTVARGKSSRSKFSAMHDLPNCRRITNQAGLEGLRRDHRQDDHGRKKKHSWTGLDKHQRLELDQSNGEGIDEHVEH